MFCSINKRTGIVKSILLPVLLLFITFSGLANNLGCPEKNPILSTNDDVIGENANNLVTITGSEDKKLKKHKKDIRILQLNLWHQATQVENGFQGLIEQIVYLDPDIITMCELHEAAFVDTLINVLTGRGLNYNGKSDGGRAVMSKFRIIETGSADKGIFKTVVETRSATIAVYSAHLNYLYYGCYYPRGYDGYSWTKMEKPITDAEEVLTFNRKAGRNEAINKFIDDATAEIAKGREVLLAGDFNEPSHLDWTADTKNMYGHNGSVIEWEVSKLLYGAGYLDAYREKNPDPVRYPGFTFPAGNRAVSPDKLTWAPEADERDRIDFIYYYNSGNIVLKQSLLAGPHESIVLNEIIKEEGKDSFLMRSSEVWPSDHKGVIVDIVLK